MNVVLLCAGYATRLYPLTLDRPKPLLELAGKPIIEHILGRLKSVSGQVDKIAVVTNAKFRPHFEEWAKSVSFPVKIDVVNDGTTSNETRLGAIGDLELAIDKGMKDKDILVLAGDNVFTFDLAPFIKEAEGHRPSITVGVSDVKDTALAKQFGIVKFDGKKRIELFVEKPQNPPSTMASLALYYFPKESLRLLDLYERQGEQDAPGYFISWLIGRETVFAYPFEGTWFDIGTKPGLELAGEFFRKWKG
ncbi:MAG: nucleotidyltransferase family protein [Candidatus Omnitrophica bacterium]|nr:nucleotidyltransferase family protein [Candidatus Omnitrophota bacterium]